MDRVFGTPFALIGTGRETEQVEKEHADRGDGGGSWRRKAMLAGAGIGLVMLIRRLRSGSRSGRETAPNEATSTAAESGSRSTDGGSGLPRKLGGLVAFVATTLALRALRKRLLGGSDRGR